jgi:hypothetical protein
VVVEKGKVRLTNVPFLCEGGTGPFVSGDMTVTRTAVELPASFLDEETKRFESRHPEARAGAKRGEPRVNVKLLAPDVLLADSKEAGQFGVEGVPVVLRPGVEVSSRDVTNYFDPSSFDRGHDDLIARSWKAQPMGVYMYCSLWSFLVSVLVTVALSCVTPRRAEAELKDLVMGLTKVPDQGPCPWYERPALWAAVIAVALVVLNVVFW